MSTLPQKIVQTSENTRYLFASTDTTAIYSFALAAFMGVILALIGVFLAWWYGKKSFDLTSKSFEITVQQILTSIDAARDNTEKTFQMNLDLIQSQREIQHKELNFRYMHEWVQSFDNLSSGYLGEVYSFIKLINSYVMRDELALGDIDKQWENHVQTLDAIDLKLQGISILKFKLLLLLNKQSELEIKIIDDLNFMDDWIRSEYIENCFAHKIAIDWEGSAYMQFFSRVQQCKKNMIEFRLSKTSEQLDSF
ncbi:hypothetical protein F4W09_14855 [Acinetobacter tandoii]|uniref:Uncharacterized protein n=1 Tax=Acinetobacter tandoii TaxID=202954 RepID=A0A5N4W7S4_9GAMM|nr:hypothetical protein [Acinetobacter tandoii]KAB1852276.1 hypothetical protein F4W09_14855 [Acinetobacter tandoii]